MQGIPQMLVTAWVQLVEKKHLSLAWVIRNCTCSQLLGERCFEEEVSSACHLLIFLLSCSRGQGEKQLLSDPSHLFPVLSPHKSCALLQFTTCFPKVTAAFFQLKGINLSYCFFSDFSIISIYSM